MVGGEHVWADGSAGAGVVGGSLLGGFLIFYLLLAFAELFVHLGKWRRLPLGSSRSSIVDNKGIYEVGGGTGDLRTSVGVRFDGGPSDVVDDIFAPHWSALDARVRRTDQAPRRVDVLFWGESRLVRRALTLHVDTGFLGNSREGGPKSSCLFSEVTVLLTDRVP